MSKSEEFSKPDTKGQAARMSIADKTILCNELRKNLHNAVGKDEIEKAGAELVKFMDKEWAESVERYNRENAEELAKSPEKKFSGLYSADVVELFSEIYRPDMDTVCLTMIGLAKDGSVVERLSRISGIQDGSRESYGIRDKDRAIRSLEDEIKRDPDYTRAKELLKKLQEQK